MTDTDKFAHRYTDLWNEPEPTARRQIIGELWSEDGTEFTDSSEHRGHDAIEARVRAAHEEFVAPGTFVFALAGAANSHHNAIQFTINMVPAGGGDIAWTGLVFVLLDDDGRIHADYQFAVS